MSDQNILNHGAKGDSNTPCTLAIQEAIDACATSGGGRVIFPSGGYVTGSLHFRDNVTFDLEADAHILGSRSIDDYPEPESTHIDAVGVKQGRALVTADQCSNIGVIGGGTIDGRGDIFKTERPQLLRFLHCENITMRDVTLRDSAAWVEHYLGCRNLMVTGIKVDSFANGNNDGINLDGCENVRVSGCRFESGDDAMTLKSTTDKKCRNIEIHDCFLRSDCNGIKFGTESVGGFEDIRITDCTVRDTRLCGIELLTVDGANLERIHIENIEMNTVGGVVFLRLGSRGYGLPADTPQHERPCGCLRDVTIRGINAIIADRIGKNPPPWFIENGARSASSLMGMPDRVIENVNLEDLDITYLGGGTAEDAKQIVDEKPAEYPQWEHWGLLPAYGFYLRHVRNLRMANIRMRTLEPDARSPIVCDDVQDLTIDGLSATPSAEGHALIQLHNVSNPNISNTSAA